MIWDSNSSIIFVVAKYHLPYNKAHKLWHAFAEYPLWVAQDSRAPLEYIFQEFYAAGVPPHNYNEHIRYCESWRFICDHCTSQTEQRIQQCLAQRQRMRLIQGLKISPTHPS